MKREHGMDGYIAHLTCQECGFKFDALIMKKKASPIYCPHCQTCVGVLGGEK